MSGLTHFSEDGAARMVDVADKEVTHRIAVAEGSISMQAATLALVKQGGHKKGDVLGIARVAGIMAAKKTAELVPLCHPLPLSHVDIELQIRPEQADVYCCARVESMARTGVEMEALTAVQVALLTIYDTCKAAERGMCIREVRLLRKSGGRSGEWSR